MRKLLSLFVVCVALVTGCKTSHEAGPIISLYQKSGGPNFERAGGTYDPTIVRAFFESHTDVLPSFVDHGVCSVKTDPASPEATQNGIICQTASSVSFRNGMKSFGQQNN